MHVGSRSDTRPPRLVSQAHRSDRAAASTEAEVGTKRRKPPDGILVGLVYAIVVFGLVMVFSASFPKAMQATPDGQPGNSLYYIRLQAAYALIGLVAMMLVSCVHPDTIARMSPRLLLATLALTAITLSNLNIVRASHGAARWLDFGPVSLQPSEFAKLALILFIAAKLAEGQLNAANFGRTTVRIGLATGLLVALLLLQKDQGMAILIGLIALMMAYLGHLRGRWLIVLSLLGIGVVVLGIYSEHYRMQRIMAYFDPLKYKTEWGWQILLMKTAIARGGLTGLGLGMCPEKFDYLPEAHTDAIFCVVASEAGLIGAVITLAAMGCIISRIVAIAVRASNNTGYFLAAGIAVMLAIQTLLNVAVATHLIPVTGLTLPFVSYGGSSLVTTLVAIGVVLSVQRHRDSVMQP